MVMDDGIAALAGRIREQFNSVTTALASKVPRSQTYTAPGTVDGYHMAIDLNFDSQDTTLKVPINVRAWSHLNNALNTVFWLNESGHARFAGAKNEATVRVYGPPTTTYQGPVFEVWQTDLNGTSRKVVYSIDAWGRPRLGTDRVIGASVLVLATGEAVPANIPAGTVIMRT